MTTNNHNLPFDYDDNNDVISENTEYIDYDISGWWTINLFLEYGNLGVTLCNITPINEGLYMKGISKYKCELISTKDKTKLNFLSATTEVKNNEILNWDISNSDKNSYLKDAYGQITNNGRFINLYSREIRREVETDYNHSNKKIDQLNYCGGGLCCLFERLEIINKPLKYLIVLRNNQRKLKRKIIKKFDKFNQIDIDIILERELDKKKYIIKNILVYNTLYVKLPKSEIMTPQQEWEADYFEEQMNELISIFRSLNAKDIEYSIIKNKINNSKKSVKMKLRNRIDGGFSNEDFKLHNTKLSYKVSYEKENKTQAETIENLLFNQEYIKGLLISRRNNELFYFLKHPEWRHQIEHRTNGLCSNMTFTHEETIKNVLNKSISTSLDKFKISYDKNHNYSVKYNILFKITYFTPSTDQDNIGRYGLANTQYNNDNVSGMDNDNVSGMDNDNLSVIDNFQE